MSRLTLGSLFSGSGGFELAGILAGIEPVWSSEIEPFPIRVTEKRLPDVKHYGDISTLSGAEVSPVDIITFGSPCFPAGTLVLTTEGLTEIENIRAGDMVLTHRNRWRRVTATGAKEAPTIRLKGNHFGLVCTGNHPIYSMKDGKRQWIPAEKMLNNTWGVPCRTEFLPIPYKTPDNRKQKPMPEFSEGFFYFVGRWLGDGWVRDGQRRGRPEGQRFSTIYLCDSYDKLDELERTVSCISERYSIEDAGTCVKIKCNGRLLCDWLTENFGRHAYGKKIPSWCYSMKRSYRTALLRGISESDGYRNNDSCKVTTVSRKLAFGIRILAETLGMRTAIYSFQTPDTCVIEGREVNQRDTYTVQFFSNSSQKTDGSISWYKVKSIAAESQSDIVYNLTVEEDNSYTADSIVVHNCQDMSVAGKRGGLDAERSGLFHEAVRIIKEMRESTNGEKPRYIVWENVPGAFSSNRGEDFRCVLEEVCKVKEAGIHIPEYKKWVQAGEIVGDGFSVCWRTLDAQHWGVPQRRKRIYLVADFAGECASKILFESEGVSGYSQESFRAWQETAGCSGESSSDAGRLCLNDQGGERMDVTEDVTTTLRAEAHHPPVVLEEGIKSAGFCTEHSGRLRGIGYEEEKSPTLRAGVTPAAMAIENHPADSRVKIEDEGVVRTLSSRMETGGGNTPLIMETPKTMQIRCGKEGGGKGALIQDDRSATLGCNNNQTLFIPRVFGICAKDSNSMKSDNPESGIYEAETTRTLDANGGNPSCNQGGMAVVALEGNGSRPSHHGDGYSEEDVSYTLNTIEKHGVAYGLDRASFNQGKNAKYDFAVEEELEPTVVARGPGAVAEPVYSASKASFFTTAEEEMANTLVATDWKDPPLVNDRAYGFYPQMKAESMCLTEDQSGCIVNGTNPGYQNGVVEAEYIVRRLTPTECARLQGFPDWWCSGLASEEPTDEEVKRWMDIFETHRKALGKTTKPKTEKQVRKWLKDPDSDSAQYKMWGNGIALPNAAFVLSGIAYFFRNNA